MNNSYNSSTITVSGASMGSTIPWDGGKSRHYSVDERRKVVYAKMSDLRKREVHAVQELMNNGYTLIQNKDSSR